MAKKDDIKDWMFIHATERLDLITKRRRLLPVTLRMVLEEADQSCDFGGMARIEGFDGAFETFRRIRRAAEARLQTLVDDAPDHSFEAHPSAIFRTEDATNARAVERIDLIPSDRSTTAAIDANMGQALFR